MTTAPTRRSILIAGAWTVPAVSLAVSTPAAAASVRPGWTLTVARTRLLPDETTTVRAVLTDGAGAAEASQAVALSLGDPAQAVLAQPTGVTDERGVFETTLRVRSGATASTGIVTLASSVGTATAVFDVQDLAPVAHDATGASTRVLALPHGIQSDVAAIENRQFTHSDLQPTGRHVARGERIDVDLPADAPVTVSLVIGARGPSAAFNAGSATEPAEVALVPGTQSVTAPQDGIVYVKNTSTDRVIELDVRGGSPHPVWVNGWTKPEEFAAQLAAWPTAAPITLVGDRVVVDVQRRVVDDLTRRSVAWDPADVLRRLDRTVADTCGVYGLTFAAVGVGRKLPGRVHFCGPDSGWGWAFAGNQWVGFQVDTGATEVLLTDPDTWGVWHEVGHTFQTPAYLWSGLTEVTVNISALVLQQRREGQHRLDDDAAVQNRLAAYFAAPVRERDHAKLTAEHPFLGLVMFDQLRQAFGEAFYPALGQAYRVRRIRGEAMPVTDQDKKDLFARMASEVAGRDLGPHFVEWGVPVSASVLSDLSTHPPLTTRPWAATNSRDARIERTVGYDLPVGILSADARVLDLGERDGTGIRVSGPTTLAGAASALVARESAARELGPSAGRLVAVLQAADGTREALWRPAAVAVRSGLQFVGIGNQLSGWLSLRSDGSRLAAVSTGVAPHDFYFKGVRYYAITLRDAHGADVVTVSVNGDDTHDKVVTALDGRAVSEGFQLIVDAAEPDRVRLYQDSAQVGALSAHPQTLTIRGGRFTI